MFRKNICMCDCSLPMSVVVCKFGSCHVIVTSAGIVSKGVGGAGKGFESHDVKLVGSR